MNGKRHKARCALLGWCDQTGTEKFVSEHKGISFRKSNNDVKVEIVDCKEPAMSEFKVGVSNESEFNIVMALAESMGYYNGLEFKYIPKVKVLFLPDDCKHIGWSDRGIEHYQKRFGKEVSIDELKEIAAGHRIDNCKAKDV